MVNRSTVDANPGQEYFHGMLPREDISQLLTVQSDYLVHVTGRNRDR